MTINISSITDNQWKKVATVALWVGLSNGVGILVTYLTSQPAFLTLGPIINIVGKAFQQLFVTEEEQSISALPLSLQQVVSQVSSDISDKVSG